MVLDNVSVQIYRFHRKKTVWHNYLNYRHGLDYEATSTTAMPATTPTNARPWPAHRQACGFVEVGAHLGRGARRLAAECHVQRGVITLWRRTGADAKDFQEELLRISSPHFIVSVSPEHHNVFMLSSQDGDRTKRSTATRRTRLRETNGLPFSVDKALRYTRAVQTAVLVVCLTPSLRYEKLIRYKHSTLQLFPPPTGDGGCAQPPAPLPPTQRTGWSCNASRA